MHVNAISARCIRRVYLYTNTPHKTSVVGMWEGEGGWRAFSSSSSRTHYYTRRLHRVGTTFRVRRRWTCANALEWNTEKGIRRKVFRYDVRASAIVLPTTYPSVVWYAISTRKKPCGDVVLNSWHTRFAFVRLRNTARGEPQANMVSSFSWNAFLDEKENENNFVFSS